MIVKCGRREFNLGENDEIMYNGVCYQIITKKYSKGFNKYIPKIAKNKAEKMIKDGVLIYDRTETRINMELKYYKINKEFL